MKQLNNAEWLHLLRLFVATDGFRPTLMKPFAQRGFVCSTNGQVLLRVDKKHTPDIECEEMKTPTIEKVMPAHDPKFTVSKAALIEAFVKSGVDYSAIEIECPHCDSECEVEWEFTDKDGDKHTRWDVCPCCDGTGFIPNGEGRFFLLDKSVFSGRYMLLLLYVMRFLNIDKVLVTIDPRLQLRFHLEDGIDMVIMPVSEIPDTYKAPVKIKTERFCPVTDDDLRSLGCGECDGSCTNGNGVPFVEEAMKDWNKGNCTDDRGCFKCFKKLKNIPS